MRIMILLFNISIYLPHYYKKITVNFQSIYLFVKHRVCPTYSIVSDLQNLIEINNKINNKISTIQINYFVFRNQRAWHLWYVITLSVCSR